MKIALIANKGGCGKTTCALLLHEAIRQTGRSSAVRDLDNLQGSASKALARFGGVRAASGQTYDVLLIDTPPSLLSPATASAVTQADLILIPTGPSPLEVWEAKPAVEFARRKHPAARVVVVLNRVRGGTLLTAAARNNLEGIGAPVLDAQLAERQSYQHAMLGGWSALDHKAREEAEAFRDAVILLAQ
jgi:chromosome partitioning protein